MTLSIIHPSTHNKEACYWNFKAQAVGFFHDVSMVLLAQEDRTPDTCKFQSWTAVWNINETRVCVLDSEPWKFSHYSNWSTGRMTQVQFLAGFGLFFSLPLHPDKL